MNSAALTVRFADACYAGATLILHGIVSPMGRSRSLLTALFSLARCAIGALRLFQVAAFPVHNLVLFGYHCLLMGDLSFRSTFIPSSLGAGMVIAGSGWLTFVSPPLGSGLLPYTIVSGIVFYGALTAWLLVPGVSVRHWSAQATMRATLTPGGSHA